MRFHVNIRFIFFCVLGLLAPVVAFAYVPPYWMIMSRVAENHGRGGYVVDQDVVFKHGEEPQIVNEKWFIQGENSMRLEVTGKKDLKDKIRITFVYENGRRYYVDQNGVKKSLKAPDDFFEPYFHFRYSKNIKPLLVEQKIAPTESLKSAPHKYSEKTPLPAPEEFLRLSRAGGAIAYAVGTPSATDDKEGAPGIWIEQDRFVIRKLRLASKLTISADQYRAFPNGLMLPQYRELVWGPNRVEILAGSAKTIQFSGKNKDLLSAANLNFGADPNVAALVPEDSVIREFYSKLR